MIVINAENLILGRIATFAAKQALLGEEVRIVNADKAVVSGRKKSVIKEKQQQANRGTPAKGPFLPKKSDRYVRRVIRGMLPHRQSKGAEAYKRILCYVGVPDEFKDAKFAELPNASVGKLPTLHYMTIGEVVRQI